MRARAGATRSARARARRARLPLLWCDAMLLSQLLDNLVDNALKYSAADAPVEMLVRALDDDVMLAVRDRGPGIAPAWRERIFEVFQRGADGERRRLRRCRGRGPVSASGWRCAAPSRARMAASCACGRAATAAAASSACCR